MNKLTTLKYLLILYFSFIQVVDAKELRIRSIFQETQAWCWAAVSEMVLRHYN